ncbi:dihydrolipoamide acetyltransferase component of pyruvate dehydrogenase complex [Microlunatus endophyticus]|uniref:Dihydrolipoamide acetyltransferase component of pyruvate dehydrogenase complex n=1 Tax=Microlunatus endophyticus TaxID=1716077 RepID=A0A917SAH6_9ACTN|nr:dihydrolipoamide acetyltransferase family protein [Microlunatus endophyticus]GGL65683.1 dihydrolipoamide acetyltransferase component of pyruvate dehydrogenase complex [Microlunatus endophyticus]
MKQFLLPDPGEGLVEADIVSWHVKPGDQIKINDVLVEVETSKSIVELPSPYAGTVSELLVNEGDTVEVGAPIILIEESASDPVEGQAKGQQTERVANLVGYGPRTGPSKRRPRRHPEPAEAPHAAVAASFGTHQPVSHRHDHREPLAPGLTKPVGPPLPAPGTPAAEPAVGGGRPLAKPPVRKLAKDLGLDLTTVTGSGDDGVITRDDVEAAATRSPEPVEIPEPVEGPSGDERVPIRGVRRATAQAMVDSAFTAPHVTEWVTCDVSATMELVEKLKSRKDFADVRVSPLLIIARACLLALRRSRSLNASWDEAAQEIVYHGAVNLGIAAATPRGLVVPNIKNVDRLDLAGLASGLNELIMTAREGKAQPADLSGGTFTITNVGVFGVDAGTPILNPGESGILAVGSISRRPWVVGSGADERIEPRWVTTLALSFDHRIVDGEQGSRFLADVAGILNDPGTALLF